MQKLLLPPIVWLVTVGLMLALYRTVPMYQWINHPWNWVGLVPIVVGIWIASWHARLFRRIGTNINTFGEPDQLTKSGLFSRSRNPMYLGLLIALMGTAYTLGAMSPMVGPFCFFCLSNYWYIPLEEKAMRLKFGEAYTEYTQAVPRWI